MNYIRLAFAFLVHKPLLTFVAFVFLVVPVTLLTSVLLFHLQSKHYLSHCNPGVDLVLIARNTPEQAILNCLFFTGPSLSDISPDVLNGVIKNPDVLLAVPFKIKGNYRGFSLVETNDNFRRLSELSLMTGRWWDSTSEAVIGFRVYRKSYLKPGEEYYPFKDINNAVENSSDALHVSGILKKSGGPLDHVILVPFRSRENKVLKTPPIMKWNGSTQDPSDSSGLNSDSYEKPNIGISAIYVKLKTKDRLPSFVQPGNLQAGIQVVDPGAELARIRNSLQFTLTALMWAGISTLIMGLLILFVWLFYFVRERSEDFILIRTLGASGSKVVFLVMVQGLLVMDLAAFTGILLSHGILGILSSYPSIENYYGISGLQASWEELLIYLTFLLLGVFVSAFPAMKARNLKVILTD